MSDIAGVLRTRSQFGEWIAACRELLRAARNRYRPERHYMRGPGPKWLAKQKQSSTER
jgi:hypothetical protein